MVRKREVDSLVTEAELVFRDFLAAMIDFETHPDFSARRPGSNERLVAELKKIQDKYCVDSKWQRQEIHTAWPSRYNVILTKTEQLSDTKIHFHVERKVAGVKLKKVIELLLDDGKWRVHRRWSVEAGKKLVADQL